MSKPNLFAKAPRVGLRGISRKNSKILAEKKVNDSSLKVIIFGPFLANRGVPPTFFRFESGLRGFASSVEGCLGGNDDVLVPFSRSLTLGSYRGSWASTFWCLFLEAQPPCQGPSPARRKSSKPRLEAEECGGDPTIGQKTPKYDDF